MQDYNIALDNTSGSDSDSDSDDDLSCSAVTSLKSINCEGKA